jgi:SAM-dependent methyltransferase
MLSAPDIADTDLLGRIPLSAQTVLEVGCGTGALAADYKRRNPAARYVGIEIDPGAAEVAAGRMDAVATADVEREPAPFGDEMFDCIIYGGVLCRLRDPWAVLRRQAQSLTERGIVLISVPNVEHWAFAEHLDGRLSPRAQVEGESRDKGLDRLTRSKDTVLHGVFNFLLKVLKVVV